MGGAGPTLREDRLIAPDGQAPDGLALQLKATTRRFGGITAVSEVDLEVTVGARHGVIGPNGAGKTTLFNVISGELKATEGRIELFGRDITRMSAPSRVALGLGRTYQITRTFNTLTVRENLTLGSHGLQRSKFSMLKSWRSYASRGREVEELAERFGLAERLDSPAADLSHGEVRQLEVALTLALKPRLLLLDEPGAGLSPGERVAMRDLLRRLPDELTLVMIEHDMDLVRDLVSRVTVLHFGRVVAEGSTAEIQNHPEVREIYLGSRA
jgi:branched-chain amino acid transport system ATP-binding protein